MDKGVISMEKESKDTKKITNVENIIEAHKRAIRLVPVNWKGRELKIPIYYSMNAANTYEKAFEKTKNYRKSFCTMALEIINNNKKVIYQEDDFPILNLEDIEGLSDNDLQKVGEEIINGSDYLKGFAEEVSEEADDFFKKFYLIHKKEIEKYGEHTKEIVGHLKPKLGFADYYKNLLPGMELTLTSKINTIRYPLIDMGIYQNTIGNSAFMELAATASKMENMIGTYMEVINPMQRNISESIIKAQYALAPTMGIVNETIKNYYSEINTIRDILQPINMEYVKTTLESQEALRNAMNNGIQSNIQVFGAELNKILNFTYNDKSFNFVNVQQDIIDKMRPFLLEAQQILFARKNISDNLNKKAKTMHEFGWWFINSLPIEIINYIYKNKETLKQEDVDKIISNYYESDECKELEEIINGWNELDYFSKWENKVRDAFHAHKLGMYSLSVPVWALMMEGIIRDFMRGNYGITAFKFSTLYDNFKEKANELDRFIVSYAFNCIDSFYIRFNPENPDGACDFSRNKIFHGQAINYDTEINSLKLMLYLDELFYIELSLKNPISA